MTERPKIALCLPGGGASGAMFQIGALAALEDAIQGFDCTSFDLYIGSSSGASVAAALAGGRPIQRLYRALVDPADVYFGLERKHLLRVDLVEWRRALITTWGALRRGASSLFRRAPEAPAALYEELERLYDSVPAGFFTLDRYERFLEDFFVRRGVPNTFSDMPKPLRIIAHDLDTGEQVLFGATGYDHIPVARACIASMAIAPFFSPVRIGERHYIDGGAAQITHLDVAVAEGSDVVVVVNPMVPAAVQSVPTGHGRGDSVRDKGMMWVVNQSSRIGIHRLLRESCQRVAEKTDTSILMIEPEPSECEMFMYNPSNFGVRRNILEHAYRTTRARLQQWFVNNEDGVRRAGWHAEPLPMSATSEEPPAATET